MRDATTLLFGLNGFRVVRVDVSDESDPEAPREVLIEGVEHEQACPACGVLSHKVHARSGPSGPRRAARPWAAAGALGPAPPGVPRAAAPATDVRRDQR